MSLAVTLFVSGSDWPTQLIVRLVGQVIVGGWVSSIVTVKAHVESGLSGDASVAVHVTVVVPTAKKLPEGGEVTLEQMPIPKEAKKIEAPKPKKK